MLPLRWKTTNINYQTLWVFDFQINLPNAKQSTKRIQSLGLAMQVLVCVETDQLFCWGSERLGLITTKS